MIGILQMAADHAKQGAAHAAGVFITFGLCAALAFWVSENFIRTSKADEYTTKAEAAQMQGQITVLTTDVRAIKSRNFERDLIGAQERYCDAWRTGNDAAQRYAVEKRRELMQEFYHEQGRAFTLPTCEELGYTPGS